MTCRWLNLKAVAYRLKIEGCVETGLQRGSEMPSVDYYMELVEQAWGLSDAAREYCKSAGRDVPMQEVLDKIFLPSGLVDIEKTRQQSGSPPKVFLKSPYGLQYRPDYKDWIPFRHGDVKFDD
jgi:hypothetical protein